MPASHAAISLPTPSAAMAQLEEFLKKRLGAPAVRDLEAFEREMHALFAAAECEALAQELARLDVDVPVILVEGIAHRRVVRCEETYFGAAGPVRITRSLYSTQQEGERAVCPMELRGGMVEGRWTPLAARQAAWVVAHLTPKEGEDLFAMRGGMKPSKSSLDRLPKQLSERWEAARERFEAALRQGEVVPEEAASVAVSLDGVMVPMKDGQREEKRARAKADGKLQRGPAGHQEVGCGTLSIYDAEGERLKTIRLARMPESKKATLKGTLGAELTAILGQRPSPFGDQARGRGQGQLGVPDRARSTKPAGGGFLPRRRAPPGSPLGRVRRDQREGQRAVREAAPGPARRRRRGEGDPLAGPPARRAPRPQEDREGAALLPEQPAPHALRPDEGTEPPHRLGRGGGRVPDARDAAAEEVGNEVAACRRASHPDAAGPGAERPLRPGLADAGGNLQARGGPS